MGASSFHQANFQGGEWSTEAQGRTDDPRYKTALNKLLNSIPTETGACLRRSGTLLANRIRNGQAGKLLDFFTSQREPYKLEFTNGHLRFWYADNPVFVPEVNQVVSVSTANPAVVTLQTANTVMATGDQVMFLIDTSIDPSIGSQLQKYIFQITVIDTTHVSLSDPVTGLTFDGSTVTGIVGFPPAAVQAPSAPAYMLRVLDLATPYTDPSLWQELRILQNTAFAVATQAQQEYSSQAIVLSGSKKIQPQLLSTTPAPTTNPQFAQFGFQPLNFADGPYLDPVSGSQAFVQSAPPLTGTFNIVVAFPAWSSTTTYFAGQIVTVTTTDYISLVNNNLNNNPTTSPNQWKVIGIGSAIGPNGFVSTDVGRYIRIFDQPPPWNATTAYVAGNSVFYNGVSYGALSSNTGKVPDSNPSIWVVEPTAAVWGWCIILSIVNAVTVTVLLTAGQLTFSSPTLGQIWRLGAFSNTTAWPTCGTFHVGRLWLGGAIPNRFDASALEINTPNATAISKLTFSPTDNGQPTVSAATAISETFDSQDQNDILWMSPDHAGLLCGTAAGEWMVQPASTASGLSALNIDSRRVTKYGCAYVEPRRTGLSLVFVQKFRHKLQEFIADVFTGRFAAPNLSKYAKHLVTGGNGIQEIAYQEELVPVVWARNGDGSFVGATYRRTSSFVHEEADFIGWHRHQLGTGRIIESMSVGPSIDGTLDSLGMITNDPTVTKTRNLEYLIKLFEENDPMWSAWFLDGASVPAGWKFDNLVAPTQLILYGLRLYEGQTVNVFACGLDCGPFTVTGNKIVVPLPAANGLLTAALIQQFAKSTTDYTPSSCGGPSQQIVQSAARAQGFPSTIYDFVIASNPPIHGPRALIDWFGDVNWVLDPLGVPGITRFKTSTGTLQVTTPYSSVLSSGYVGDDGTGSAVGDSCVDKKDNIYIWSTKAASSNQLNKINGLGSPMANVWSITGPFGTGTLDEGYLAVNSSADADYLCAVRSDISSGGTSILRVYNAATPTQVGTDFTAFQVGTTTMIPTAGPSGKGFATFYSIGVPSGSPAFVPLYITAVLDAAPLEAIVQKQKPGLWDSFLSFLYGYDYNSVINNLKSIVLNNGYSTFELGGVGFLLSLFTGKASGTPTVATPVVVTTLLGSLTANAIDPTWTSITNTEGLGFDKTDGNLIVRIGTAAGPTVTNYIVKLDARTLAVLWKVPLNPAAAGCNALNLNRSNIDNGVLGFFSNTQSNPPDPSGTRPYYLIDTITGKWFIQMIARASITTGIAPAQAFDSRLLRTYAFLTDPNPASLGAWASGTTYNLQDVVLGSDGILYKSLAAGNLGNNPVTDTTFVHWSKEVPSPINSTAVPFTGVWGVMTVGSSAPQSLITGQTAAVAPTGSTVSRRGYAIQYAQTWSSLVSYNLGDVVIASDGNLYISLVVGTNLAADPVTTPANWSFIGPPGNYIPVIVGTNFTTQGQLLRPATEKDAGSQAGPPFGKVRRIHQFAAFVKNAIKMSFGTTFTALNPATFKAADETTPLTALQPFSGVHWDTIDDDFSKDGMLCWQVSDPYPGTIMSLGGYIRTQDK